MRAVWITRPGGPEALEVRETADPGPGPEHEVLRAEGCTHPIDLTSGQRRRPARLATQVLGIPLLTPLQLTYSFTGAAEAHHRILQRRNIGKVLLIP